MPTLPGKKNGIDSDIDVVTDIGQILLWKEGDEYVAK